MSSFVPSVDIFSHLRHVDELAPPSALEEAKSIFSAKQQQQQSSAKRQALEIFDGSDAATATAASVAALGRSFVTAIHEEHLVIRCVITRKQSSIGVLLNPPLFIFQLDEAPSSPTGTRKGEKRKTMKKKEYGAADAANDEDDSKSSLSVYVKKCTKLGQNCFHTSLTLSDLNSERYERSKGFLGKLKVKGNRSYVLQDAGINPARLLPFDYRNAAAAAATHNNEVEGNEDEDVDSNGKKEKQLQQQRKEVEQQQFHNAVRCELAAICFNKDDDGNEIFEVGIPQINSATGIAVVFQPEETASSKTGSKREKLLNNFKVICNVNRRNDVMRDAIYCMKCNSKYSSLFRNGSTDYYGREIIASRKSFWLGASEENDGNGNDDDDSSSPPILTMHRIQRHVWAMEFRYPLSMYQAIGICMSRF
jgi:hypothetical protein